MMIYACEECGFLFCRADKAGECPSCDKDHIRLASVIWVGSHTGFEIFSLGQKTIRKNKEINK